MTDETEAGDVGGGLSPKFRHDFSGDLVERRHVPDDHVRGRLIQQSGFKGSIQNAGAQWFGEYQPVAGPRPALGQHLTGVNDAGDRQAEFNLRILDTMAADQSAASLVELIKSASQHQPQHLYIDVFSGKTNETHSGHRASAHGVDVRQGISRRHLPEGEGIVDDRRDNVDGLHQGNFRREQVNPGVIGLFQTDQNLRVSLNRQAAERFS